MALGWIIESNSEGKLRFIAPNGMVYDDLREVCKLVTEQEEKARAGSGESKKKEPRVKLNWKPLPIEPKPCHEAVVAYVRKGRRRHKLRPTVVQHIVSLGWMVECYEEKYRYRAPDGKMHCSLLEICRSLTGPPEQDARGSSSAEQEETSED
ncbi:hypothetical protein QJS10_CPB21g01292 [Acorus calamus]|uniref:DUF7028 domain-containing protein n=1 Tax=Acorus calamus TaxID=4465 RepID=A0AAV9C8J4_ACOCL|nr:hypothetical protein QJS10_CPB21g01292 [Acorus calamus]